MFNPVTDNPALFLTLAVTMRLVAFSLGLQSLEMFHGQIQYSENGVWRWSLLRRDFLRFGPMIKIFDLVFGEKGVIGLVTLQFAMVFALLGYSQNLSFALIWVGVLWCTTLLLAMRWRGAVQGGGDAMTLVVLTGLAIALVGVWFGRPEIGLWYIAFHVMISYVRSGFVKISKREWRSGESLRRLLLSRHYGAPGEMRGLAQRGGLVRVLAWVMLIFECSFPLALVSGHFALGYIGFAILFHLANIYLFGLNRFLWAWLAAYPALWFCAQS